MAVTAEVITPLLGVFDMATSVAFYRDLLGFEVVSASPEVETREGRFSHWVWLRLGAADVMLNTLHDSGERPMAPDPARVSAHGDTWLYFACADLGGAYRDLTARGLRSDPPTMAPYGLTSFHTMDPDGYRIIFQQARQD